MSACALVALGRALGVSLVLVEGVQVLLVVARGVDDGVHAVQVLMGVVLELVLAPCVHVVQEWWRCERVLVCANSVEEWCWCERARARACMRCVQEWWWCERGGRAIACVQAGD